MVAKLGLKGGVGAYHTDGRMGRVYLGRGNGMHEGVKLLDMFGNWDLVWSGRRIDAREK